MLFPGIPEPLCCLHQSLLVALAPHGAWVSHLARDRQWDRGSLAREMTTWELDWLLIPRRWGWNQRPQSLATARPKTPACVRGSGALRGALGQTQSRGSLQTRPGRPAQVFFSIPHRPQLGGLALADIPGWAQLAKLASQTGEDLGLQLQWSPACAKAAGTCVALASLVPLVPRRGRGSSEMLHSSFVLLLFSRESLILKQYFRFCLCSVSAKVTCCVK